MLLMGLKDCESGGDRKYKNQKKIKCKKCGNDMRSGDLYMYCKICWNLVFDEGVCTYTGHTNCVMTTEQSVFLLR